jgi:hypothetical protein
MTRRFTSTLLTVVARTLCARAVVAHPGHEQRVMGTVTMAASDHVMLKDPQGKDVTIQINTSTKFVRAKKAMTADDMRVGMRVVVTAVTDQDDDKLIAQSIELGKPPATK